MRNYCFQIGAVIVFSTATIILGNSIHLDRTYGHERISTVLVTTIAIFMTLIQFFICLVSVTVSYQVNSIINELCLNVYISVLGQTCTK